MNRNMQYEVYRQMRVKYLEVNYPDLLHSMEAMGTLDRHLTGIEIQAQSIYKQTFIDTNPRYHIMPLTTDNQKLMNLAHKRVMNELIFPV